MPRARNSTIAVVRSLRIKMIRIATASVRFRKSGLTLATSFVRNLFRSFRIDKSDVRF